MKIKEILLLSITFLLPSIVFAETERLEIQVLVCNSEQEAEFYSFLKIHDGSLTMLGSGAANISATATSLTVVDDDTVLQFQDAQLRSLKDGQLSVKSCTDTTEPFIHLHSVLMDLDDTGRPFASDLVPMAISSTSSSTSLPLAAIEAFQSAVSRCWNVDPSSAASKVTVKVSFVLDRDGRVRGNAIEMISASGNQDGTDAAFQAARRAILRCQSGGFDLPSDTIQDRQDVTLEFNPESGIQFLHRK